LTKAWPYDGKYRAAYGDRPSGMGHRGVRRMSPKAVIGRRANDFQQSSARANAKLIPADHP
jgi:hypothetical protein